MMRASDSSSVDFNMPLKTKKKQNLDENHKLTLSILVERQIPKNNCSLKWRRVTSVVFNIKEIELN